jgi:hypothetical protein
MPINDPNARYGLQPKTKFSTFMESSTFLYHIRDGRFIEEKELQEVCNALRELAKEWQTSDKVDKRDVVHLYELIVIPRNMMDHEQRESPQRYEKLVEIVQQVDECIQLCLVP